jgi:NAD(P)-dependent dehydrogenase (short-subunit alcohol dehydrogenase family)
MSDQTAPHPLRILVTGVSSGFGRALAAAAVARGHDVIGTVRTEHDRTAFDAEFGERAHAELLDVTAFPSCATVVQSIEREAGPIDVLVNNAGYGHEGTLEESPLDEMRLQFDVNVFGAVAMMQAVLPFMRARRRGHVINITSMGGYITLPGIAFYTGSKFALEGISGSLAAEVRGFGIKVTAVAPGGFRTDWAGRSMRRSERTIADYDEVFEPIRAGRFARHGNQIGDPRKAALVLLDLMMMPDPPVHLLLGSDAVNLVSEQLENTRRSILEYADLSRSTDAPPIAQTVSSA